ncbi:MAG: DUF4197 domain-containing protein [Chitinophagaceae bacterium]
MKKLLAFSIGICLFGSCETLSNLPGMPASGMVTEADAGQGIKEALTQGASTAILNLNKENAFFGNDVYKMFLPADAQKIESTLRKIGMGKQVDKAILQINRAAEDAVGYAKPVFIDAIKQMTLTDALNIVRGNQHAATDYFRDKTNGKIIEAFSPSIQRSLEKLNATRYYTEIVTIYNNLPTTFNKVNPDLNGFVAAKATAALFDQVEKEEANIRVNPLARTSDILKKVFGTKLY